MTTRNFNFDFGGFEDAMMSISPYQRKQDAIEGFDRVRNARPSFGGSTRKGRAEMLYGRRAEQASAAADYAAYMASQGM
jgi:hypothetical protein